ncbi:DUF1572 domain-containing protein [Radiobacillus kanasensis]|uniref:DinB family protein n=1 Tax=Radiobacillus kanasensis TaxID=2844358 RepID=UPI001E4763AE|nr:DinB family protein [Radiobacillus kanasensis]UFT99619.1 DUF1572 domain-containing protein [Radiobacillus kanasensis]
MEHQVVLSFLQNKMDEIQNRMRKVIDQLDEEDINWRPNKESNSIGNLVIHIDGNIHQRVEAQILGLPDRRDRDKEFNHTIQMKKDEIIQTLGASFSTFTEAVQGLNEEDLQRKTVVNGKEVSVLEVLMRCTNHYSEHLGQIMYIAKLRLGDQYITTTIPK